MAKGRNVLLIFLALFLGEEAFAQFKLYEKGHNSYTAGKYDEAIRYFSEYLTKATRDKAIDIDVFYLRALSYYKTNQFAESIPDFEETILRGHANKGNIYWFMAKSYEKMNQDAESVNSYNNAQRELKGNAEALGKIFHERGLIHKRMGNNPQAIADLKEALASNPRNNAAAKELEVLAGQVSSSRQTPEPDQNKSTKDKKPAKESVPVATGNPKKGVHSNQENNNTAASASAPELVKNDDKKSELKKEDQKVNDGKEESGAPASSGSVAQNEIKQDQKIISAPNSEPVSPWVEFYKDEKRYALVIGNSNYPKEIGLLRNPMNDATDMAQELKESHFEVQLLTNATYGQIRAALMKFKEKLDGGDPEKTVGLFYFAGHGLQYDDENYLVPTDASVQYEDDIPRYCFPIQRMVLSNMERSNTRMNILVLDACRNNPFPSINRNLGGSGLGEMKRARGTFIAYATAPGSVASDGPGRNGLYTQELLKALKKKGLTIEQVFKEVRANVLKLSGQKQNTWDSSNIVGEFHFKY